MEKNEKFMRRVLVVLTVSFWTMGVDAQVINSATFRPFSYSEMMAPAMMATQAFKAAEADLEEYYVKANSELKQGNYDMALFYLERCSRINRQFDGNICDQASLNSAIAKVKSLKQGNSGTRYSTSVPVQPKDKGHVQYNLGYVQLHNSYEIPMRQLASVNSPEIKQLPKQATVEVLEVWENDAMMKVKHNGVVGWISKAWLKK